MATHIPLLTNPLVFGDAKSHHYANDDCIIHPLDSPTDVVADSFSLKQRPISFDYAHELEFMRDSLGRTLQQKVDATRNLTTKGETSSNPAAESRYNTDPIDMTAARLQVSSRVLHLLKELETCLDKVHEPEKQSKLKYLSAVFSQVSGTPPSNHNSSLNRKDKPSEASTPPLLYNPAPPSLPTDSTQITLQKATPLALLSSWAHRYNSTFFTRHNWKRRFFLLTQLRLLRFKNSTPSASCECALDITPDTKVEILDRFSGKQNVLQITTPANNENSVQIWHLYMESINELQIWLNKVRSNVSSLGHPNQLTGSRTSFCNTLESQSNEADLLRRISTRSAPPHSRFRSKSYSWRPLPPQPPVPQYSPPAPPCDQRKQYEGRTRSQSTCSAFQRKYMSWEP